VQKGCRYTPHILAFQTNQDFEIVNEDQNAHNCIPAVEQPASGTNRNRLDATRLEDRTRPEFIPIKCNITTGWNSTLAVRKNSPLRDYRQI